MKVSRVHIRTQQLCKKKNWNFIAKFLYSHIYCEDMTGRSTPRICNELASSC